MDPALNYSDIPSAPPPPGVIPNFVNPETNAAMTTIVISILLPLMLAFVLLRVYACFRISHKWAKSDYACILAAIASISYTSILYLIISQHIFGSHIWDVPISRNTNSSVQNFTVFSILYGPSIFLAKLSVLLLYLELFIVNKMARIMVAIALAIITSQCLATMIGNAVLCVPKPGVSWEIGDDTYNCMVVADLFSVIMGTVSVFSDLFVIYIPIPVVWQLQLPTRKRVGICLIFITGLFACLASILALVYRIRQYKTKDNTWNATYTYMLTVVEINVSIMCSCMPFWPAYFRHHSNSLRSLSSRLRSKYFRGSSARNQSSSTVLKDFERVDSKPEDNMRLTLGSAVREGTFFKSPRSWPLAGGEEGVKETIRESSDESTQGSVG